jgi:hypothetical protein
MSLSSRRLGWDPQNLRLIPGEGRRSQGHPPASRRASPIQGKFIAGPVDVAWVCRASRLGVKALLVGLALWHVKGLRRSATFILSNLMVQEWGVSRDAKRRGLRALERAGLILIERRGKRSPQVTLVLDTTVSRRTV